MTEIPEHLLKRAEAARQKAAGVEPDRRPHSRACGLAAHEHGRACSMDCPTCNCDCGGKGWVVLHGKKADCPRCYPPEALPKWFEFDYYLHDSYEVSEAVEVLSEKYTRIPAEVWQKMAARRPFYEVKVVCRLNTETGEVQAVRAEL